MNSNTYRRSKTIIWIGKCSKTLAKLSCFVLFIFSANTFAQQQSFGFVPPTIIPETKEKREHLVNALEARLKTKKDSDVLKEFAIIQAVIATENIRTKKQLEQAHRIIKEAIAVLPNDSELVAVQGSLITLNAQYVAQNSSQSMTYLKEGIDLMDKAVRQDPNNIGALLWRGLNSLNLPSFLDRKKIAIKDFEKINILVGNSFGPEFSAMIHFYLGNAYDQGKNKANAQQALYAEHHWKKAVDLKAGYWSNLANKNL